MVANTCTSARAPGLYLLTGLIAGLLAADQWVTSTMVLLASASVSALMALRFYNRPLIWTLLFLLSSTLAFWAYGSARLPNAPAPFALELPPREATVLLHIERILQADNKYGKTNLIARVVEAPPLSRLQANTRIYCCFRSTDSPLQRGMQIEATAVLKPIRSNSDNSFDDYLRKIDIHYRFERNSMIRLVHEPSSFERFCRQANQRFQYDLCRGSPNQRGLAEVYTAMLLGQKAGLSKAQAERYRTTGTMHFFAISGLHIGVIATAIAQFLGLIRVPSRLAAAIGLLLLYLYVEITGAPPSAVRAFLMTAFFWASFAFRRQRNPFAALVGSAIFVLIIEPTQLWSIGFQLSYSVVLSILLFGLPLQQQLNMYIQPFRWLPKASWSKVHHCITWANQQLILLFAISFSAWLASTPLSAGLFGFIAPGAILLNMLLEIWQL